MNLSIFAFTKPKGLWVGVHALKQA